MSNHFPTVPDLELVTLTYSPNMNNAGTGNLMALAGFSVEGISVAGNILTDPLTGSALYPILNLVLNFTTPGDAGSFDQDSAESELAGLLDSLCEAVTAATGAELATVQGWVTINRTWFYQDSTDNWALTYTDTMTYPS